jgi:hypothetical protein
LASGFTTEQFTRVGETKDSGAEEGYFGTGGTIFVDRFWWKMSSKWTSACKQKKCLFFIETKLRKKQTTKTSSLSH